MCLFFFFFLGSIMHCFDWNVDVLISYFLFEARRSRKVIWNEKKMRPKRTTNSKVMGIQNFQIYMRILCLSNHLRCSFSLYLLVDLEKTYQNEWSQCSNDQIIKNLWLSEVRNLLIQYYATQYCNGTSISKQGEGISVFSDFCIF